jgi:hypothetical protein
MQALRYKPTGFWLLDDTAPFQDYSGYARSGTLSGTERHGIALSSDALYSQVFNNAVTAAFPSPVYTAGRESNAFSLAASVYVAEKTEGVVDTTPYRENRHLSPSFEHASSYASSGYAYSTYNGFDTTTFVTGSRSLKYTRNATPLDTTIALAYVSHPTLGNAQAIAVTPGEVVSAGAWVRPSVTCRVNMAHVWRNAAGSSPAVTPTVYTTIPANTWTWVKNENQVVPADIVVDQIRLDFITVSGNVVGGEVVNVDSVMVNSGPVVYDYFDGEIIGYEWDDTRYLSKSKTTTVERINLVTNPSFETNTTGWGVSAGATIARVTSGFTSGSGITSGASALEVTLAATNQSGATFTVPAVEQNTQYTLSMDVTGISGDLTNFGLRVSGAGGTWGITAAQTLTPGATVRLHTTFTSNVAATSASIFAWRSGVAGGTGVVRIDSVLFEKYNAAPYMDGDTPGYTWDGTAHASISRRLMGVARINYARNPGMEINPGSYSNNPTYYPITWDNTYARTGTRSVRSTRANSGVSVPRSLMSAYGAGDYATLIPVNVGETYTISAYFRLGQGTGYEAYVGFYTYNSAGAGTSTSVAATGTAIPLAAGWENRASHTMTIQPGVSFIRLRADVQKIDMSGVAPDGDFVNMDNVLFEKSSTVGSYFDGDTTGAAWNGAANSTASYMQASVGPVQILSNQYRYDGLSIDGTKISFSTRYKNTGEAKATYDMQVAQKVDIVGVHTDAKNSLYVNGVLVAEVDITPAQQADTYDAPDANLYSGRGMSSQTLLVNNLATFSRALQTEEVAALWRSNNRRPEGSIPKMYGGEDVLVSTAVRPLFLDTGWYTDEDWNAASLTGVAVEDGQLNATMSGGLTKQGYWIDSVDLYTGETPVAVNSVNLWWNGINETVEASIDGTTWAAVVKGQNLSIIPTGFDPTNKALYIRVSFPAGKTEAYVDSLEVNGYSSSTAMSNNRLLTYTNPAVVFDEQTPALLRDDWGVRLSGTGSIRVSPDTSETPTNPATL